MLAQKSGRVAKYLGINIVLWATYVSYSTEGLVLTRFL
jgi:hypothetical protein